MTEDAVRSPNFVYIDVIVSDCRIDERRKGVGHALIDAVKRMLEMNTSLPYS